MENVNMNEQIEQERNKKDEGLSRFLEFTLGEEDFAVPLLEVREVISVPETTPIPDAKNYYVGIMNLRGQVITIIDLRKKMGITPQTENKEEAVIILNHGEGHIGVVVDSINSVLALESSQILDMPQVEGSKHANNIDGVFKQEDRFTVLLDVNKLLGDL
mgnify:CR=1 FL=1